MTLDLNSTEAASLKQALDARVGGLMNELVHTDDRSYREYLKQTISMLEQLQKKLEQSVSQGARATA